MAMISKPDGQCPSCPIKTPAIAIVHHQRFVQRSFSPPSLTS